jgi:hypothetical protein
MNKALATISETSVVRGNKDGINYFSREAAKTQRKENERWSTDLFPFRQNTGYCEKWVHGRQGYSKGKEAELPSRGSQAGWEPVKRK